MLITYEHPKPSNKFNTNQEAIEFNILQHTQYQSIGNKIDAFLLNKKNESNPDMFEKFYFSLLPVTYRDWMR